MCKWADDSHRFILNNFDMICDSPSEIYHHALPFSPSSSWLHEYYSPERVHGVKVVKGLQSDWGTCSRTVSFDHNPLALACWKDLVVVGFTSGNITIHDAITGIPMSELSSHASRVRSVAFSPDGTFLVSGSDDKTANLWDVQTGGVIKTFHGHTEWVYSVSISPDCTMIASGSLDHTIRLWDAQKGECCLVIEGHSKCVNSVAFSPTNSQLLISASDDGTVQKWDVEGHQVGSVYKGNHVALSSDGTHLVSWEWGGKVATVQDFGSGVVVAKLQPPGGEFHRCCFSPDGKFVAGGVDETIYIWDITRSDPCLVETFIGHTDHIISLVFSSSLISSSWDKSIRFWQTGVSPTDPVAADSKSTSLFFNPIESVSLQATDSIAISIDFCGVAEIWDISSGLCKESFQTPVNDTTWMYAQLIDGSLTLVWIEDEKIHIWESKKGEPHQTLDVQLLDDLRDFSISGDKSKVFLLYENSIQAWSICTGETVGMVDLEGEPLYDSLVVGSSRVWVYFMDSQILGWDFGFPDSTPVPLFNTSADRPHLSFIGTERQCISPSRIEDTVTGREVFQLSGRYASPREARCDGRYLIAGYEPREVLILDFSHMITQ